MKKHLQRIAYVQGTMLSTAEHTVEEDLISAPKDLATEWNKTHINNCSTAILEKFHISLQRKPKDEE